MQSKCSSTYRRNWKAGQVLAVTTNAMLLDKPKNYTVRPRRADSTDGFQRHEPPCAIQVRQRLGKITNSKHEQSIVVGGDPGKLTHPTKHVQSSHRNLRTMRALTNIRATTKNVVIMTPPAMVKSVYGFNVYGS